MSEKSIRQEHEQSINPFSQIKLRELPTWIKVLKEDCKTTEEILSELELIDRLLILQASKVLMMRRTNFHNQIDNLLSLYLGYAIKPDMQFQKEATKKRNERKLKAKKK